jgi:hypothetical protein
MQNPKEFAQGGHRPPIPLDLQAEVRNLKTSLAALSNTVKQLGGTSMKKREQIPFSRTLAIPPAMGSGVTIEEKITLTGFVKEVTIHWPAGCNALVDVAVEYETTRFCPRQGFIALNDTTPTFPFNFPVVKDHNIRVIMQNRDGGFVHNITVTVTIEEG